MRYFCAIIAMVLAIFGVVFMTGNSRLIVFFDFPSLIITVLFPIVFMGILKGFSVLKTVFTIQTNKNATKETLVKTNLFFRMYGNITWLSSALAIVIGSIDFLANAENWQTIGPNAALALISVLYATIINIIILPFKIYTKEKLNEII
jgi:flagellar motor component MotA